jgi:hypothetical protein
MLFRVMWPLTKLHDRDNLGTMSRNTAPQGGTPLPRLLAGWLAFACAACAASGPFVPDKTHKVLPPSAREGGSADDVFLRHPWELWRVPTGTARYHRGAHMLLPDKLESFQVREVSVYQADGSDVRIDYYSVDLGGGSQAHESISVFVYPATGDLDSDWKSAVERVRRQWPGATTTQPFRVPRHHPPETKQMAVIAPGPSGREDDATFVQTILFHEGKWAVRYEVSCPAADLEATREKTRAFLRSLRAEEYSNRIS